jgi:hypothetical protein
VIEHEQGPVSDSGLTDERRAELARERIRWRFSLVSIRAARWALFAFFKARHDLPKKGLGTRVAPPPKLPWGARGGVFGVLNRTKPTCLERAMVLQAWLLAYDMPHDIIVGVAQNAGDVKAHAWVDGVASGEEADDYTPIHRIAPRRP